MHEEILRGPVSELLTRLKSETPRGEFVVVVSGKDAAVKKAKAPVSEKDIGELVRNYENQGLSRMDAMKQAARDLGISKRDVYKSLLENRSLT